MHKALCALVVSLHFCEGAFIGFQFKNCVFTVIHSHSAGEYRLFYLLNVYKIIQMQILAFVIIIKCRDSIDIIQN